MQLLANPTEFARYLKDIKQQIPQYLLLKDTKYLQKIVKIPSDVFFFKGDANIPSKNISENERTNRMFNVLVHKGTETFNDTLSKLIVSNQIDETETAIKNLPNIIGEAYKTITEREPSYSFAMTILMSGRQK